MKDFWFGKKVAKKFIITNLTPYLSWPIPGSWKLEDVYSFMLQTKISSKNLTIFL